MYHNEQHINFLLSKLEEWKRYQYLNDISIDDDILTAITESIWWHDIVYNIWNPPTFNELDSAKEASQALDGLYNQTVISNIVSAIAATAYHLYDQDLNYDSLVTKVMLDVDMAGFGEDYSIVKMNSDNILEESFMAVGNLQTLLNNRINFLKKLLKT